MLGGIHFDIVFGRGIEYFREVESFESLETVVYHTDAADILQLISMSPVELFGLVATLTW